MERDIKIVKFKPAADKAAESVAEADRENREEMARMLQETLDGVKSGEITGFVFIGRKKLPEDMKIKSPRSRDYFEYIVANALDIGLIGEIMVINNRLIALYDQYTDTSNDEDDAGDE